MCLYALYVAGKFFDCVSNVVSVVRLCLGFPGRSVHDLNSVEIRLSRDSILPL